jgi:hypothetical protein
LLGVPAQSLAEWWRKQREADNIGRNIFLLLYFVANVVIFIFFAVATQKMIDDSKATATPKDLSGWVALAKGFGRARSMLRFLLLLGTR